MMRKHRCIQCKWAFIFDRTKPSDLTGTRIDFCSLKCIDTYYKNSALIIEGGLYNIERSVYIQMNKYYRYPFQKYYLYHLLKSIILYTGMIITPILSAWYFNK